MRSTARTCRSSRWASTISNCRSNIRTKDGRTLTLEASVTGTVSLEADLKGINMSRIVRSFYEHKDEVLTGEWMGRDLEELSAQREEQECATEDFVFLSDAAAQPAQRAGQVISSTTWRSRA